MKTNFTKLITVPLAMLALAGCSLGQSTKFGSHSNSSLSDDPNGGGAGAKVVGTGALSVPTPDALVARISRGLQGNVSPMTGNFAKSLAAVKTNLPKVPDPTKATGFDQAQLLVYAACSDLTTGTLMKTKYNVDKGVALTDAENSAITAAGVTMLDQYTAGLASQGPTAADVRSAISSTITAASAAGDTLTPANTTTVFLAVCMAANTAGSMMMSF